MRRLSPEEAALWRRFAGTVRRAEPEPVAEIATHPLPLRRQGPLRESGAKPSHRPLPSQGRREAGNSLDGSWDKRISTGRIEPDMTIDLHGETLASAHARLNRSLDVAVRTGARIILLITGKPARDNPRLPPTSRGVIRASVSDWLAASSHAGRIAAIRTAHPRHGGAGALYVILRRER